MTLVISWGFFEFAGSCGEGVSRRREGAEEVTE